MGLKISQLNPADLPLAVDVLLEGETSGGTDTDSGPDSVYFSLQDIIDAAAAGLTGSYQPLDADLTAFAGLSGAADKVPYFTGTHTLALADFTSFARSLVDDANAGAARTTLGLGTAATLDSDTDVTLAANSDLKFATQKAVKTYIDGIVTGGASDVMIFKGVIDCSANPNYPAADAGNLYKISVAGKIGGASGPNVEAGDTIYCITDSTASGTQAGVGANWVIAQVNVDGAYFAGGTDVAVADGGTGASSASGARTNLGLVIGTDVQAHDGDLDTIGGLTATTDNFMQAKASAWASRTPAQVAADLSSLITPTECICIAVSDETTALTAGTAKATFRMPYAFTLTDVRASVTTAPTGGTLLAVDVNESGTTILSTKLTFDASEKTTTTAATPRVISDSSLADDAEMTVDIDAIGSTIAGAGLKVYLIGHRT
jgi:hypothetical protein